MARFRIEWDDGKVEVVEQSDCHTLEQFLNCRFGSAGFEGMPAKVTLEDHKPAAEPAPAAPAVKPAKK